MRTKLYLAAFIFLFFWGTFASTSWNHSMCHRGHIKNKKKRFLKKTVPRAGEEGFFFFLCVCFCFTFAWIRVMELNMNQSNRSHAAEVTVTMELFVLCVLWANSKHSHGNMKWRADHLASYLLLLNTTCFPFCSAHFLFSRFFNLVPILSQK